MPDDLSKPEKPVPALERLLSTSPLLSEPIEIKRGADKIRLKFREVPNDMKNRIKEQAIQFVEDRRRKFESEGEGEWRGVDEDLMTLKAEEQELRMLQAAMIDLETDGPACSLDWLRRRMGTELQAYLGEKYKEFEDELSPDKATDDDVKSLIEDLKKNEAFPLLWMRYGSRTALSLLVCLANHPEISQIAWSFGGSSGEVQP